MTLLILHDDVECSLVLQYIIIRLNQHLRSAVKKVEWATWVNSQRVSEYNSPHLLVIEISFRVVTVVCSMLASGSLHGVRKTEQEKDRLFLPWRSNCLFSEVHQCVHAREFFKIFVGLRLLYWPVMHYLCVCITGKSCLTLTFPDATHVLMRRWTGACSCLQRTRTLTAGYGCTLT